ncbi:restriction endonuclease subunit S [Alphaproteobacteria bacterium]|nr:restriction endonuclease subunit S [Alphaproteobacteria bacterium]
MNWKTKKLGDICQFVRGPFGGSLKKSFFVESGYAVYEQRHAIKNTCENFRYFVTQEKYNEMSRFAISPGDILMSCSGTIGKTTVVPKEAPNGIINQALLKITPSKEIDVRFLKYYMESNLFADQLMDTVDGAAIQNVASVKILKDITINLPPLEEQQRILAILDTAFNEIDGMISLTEGKKKEASNLFQSALSNIIENENSNYSSASLDEIANFIDYRGKTPKKTENGVVLLTAKNIRMGYIKDKPKEFISEEEYNIRMTRGFPKLGDVVFTTEAPLGLVAQIKDDSVALGQRLITFQIKKKIIQNSYLKYLLMSRRYQQEIFDKGTGATVKGIKASLLKKIEISFPSSLDEQAIRVKNLLLAEENTNELKTIYSLKLNELSNLKSAILVQELQRKSKAA